MADRSLKLTCVDGINQQLEAMSRNQCYDARNVWERGGKLVQRPGYVGVTSLSDTSINTYVAATNTVLIKETPVGTFGPFVATGANLNVANLPAGSRWYLGMDTAPSTMCELAVTHGSNANHTQVFVEYWNGSSWVGILGTPIEKYGTADGWHLTGFYPGGGAMGAPLEFSALALPPRDWAQTTITDSLAVSATKYYLRFTIVENAIDAVCTVNNTLAANTQIGTGVGISGLFSISTDTDQRFLTAQIDQTTHSVYYRFFRNLLDLNRTSSWQGPGRNIAPRFCTAAIVQAFGEVFTALGGEVIRHSIAGGSSAATVETGLWAIGTGAPYDLATLSQLAAFPRANIIAFFQNRLWFADTEGERTVIRWGAAAPYHKVLPSLAFEYVDQQPTALRPLGENMVVYTQDSIHLSILDNIDDFGVPRFKFLRNVTGRGCVSPNSIQEINGEHIFLSDDGLYRYNGSSNVRKATLDKKTGADRLESTLARITSSARQLASSVHWKKQRVYMLSVPVDGSTTNNLTIVWDYEKDKFWLWDNIGAQFWLNENSPTTDETIYFADSAGRIFQFGQRDSDYGEVIDPWVVTSPLGLDDSLHHGLTEVKVLARNTVAELNFEVWPNGDAGNAEAGECSLSDYREAKWGTAVWGTSKWPASNVRARGHNFDADGSYFQVKISGAGEAGKPFSLSRLDISLIDKYEDS